MQEFNENIDFNLKQLPVEGGFKVPEGYFDDMKVLVYFQTVYQQQHTSEEPIEDEYFKQSRQNILLKTTQQKGRIKTLWPTTYAKQFSVAASALLVAGILFSIYKPQQQAVSYPQLNEEEIIGYLQQDPMREVPVEEVVKLVPVNDMTVEIDEEEYLILETL